MRLAPVPAALLLAAAGAAALLAEHLASAAVISALLLAVILAWAPAGRRRLYLVGVLVSSLGVLVISPFVAVVGSDVLWGGPTVPVLGTLDVTREELSTAALAAAQMAAVALAFAAYALLLDHDRLLGSLWFARRSAFTAVLATRLVPTLERDGAALAESVRGRGIPVDGLRGRAQLVSPLVSGSLERALNLAEAMEARGYGRPGRTRRPGARWSCWDRAALAGAVLLVIGGVLWL
jgi:energy-coupling factor transport system permease protein